MNILAGGPARETESDLFLLHREGLEAQNSCPCGSSKWVDEQGQRVHDWQSGVVCRACESPGNLMIEHEIVPDPGGPRWNPEKIERVAKVRQYFMDKACYARRGVAVWGGGLFMVDTDVICGPGVLERMLAVDADVVFGVFQTKCSWGGPYGDWPQVWTRHPYGFDEDTARLLVEPGVNEIEVFGGGACTLIRGRGFESRYWPRLTSLSGLPGMWPGEDRSYCLGLEARGIRMVAVTGLPIVHLHTDHSPEALDRARTTVGLSRSERV